LPVSRRQSKKNLLSQTMAPESYSNDGVKKAEGVRTREFKKRGQKKAGVGVLKEGGTKKNVYLRESGLRRDLALPNKGEGEATYIGGTDLSKESNTRHAVSARKLHRDTKVRLSRGKQSDSPKLTNETSK